MGNPCMIRSIRFSIVQLLSSINGNQKTWYVCFCYVADYNVGVSPSCSVQRANRVFRLSLLLMMERAVIGYQ